MPKNRAATPTRIALFWDNSSFLGQRIQAGVYRLAEQEEGLLLQRFDGTEIDFAKRVVQPLRQWNPDGAIIYSGEVDVVRKLRKALPSIPFVAANRLPPSLVQTIVGSNWTEIITMCRDHFLARGVETMALFSVGNSSAAKSAREMMEKLVPGVRVFSQTADLEDLVRPPRGSFQRAVGNWLKQLPKPVGVCSFEVYACGYLSRICRKLKLNIPEAVQVIGPDDIDGCLACDPPLTSFVLPAEAIGSTAMKILLQYIRGARPTPEPLVLVSGSSLIERGSTSALPSGGKMVSKALNLVRSDAIRGLTAKQLVQQSEVSTRTLYKGFRDATGVTPAKMLREVRLEEACRLLRETSLTIEQIVEKCGFGSASYFSQVFRRTKNMTPTRYRLSHLKP
jgi:LacI family transcriptional regulator